MATNTATNLDALGYANDWKTKPERVETCQRLGHNIVDIVHGADTHEIQCRHCGYTYSINSARTFRVPDIHKSTMRFPDLPSPAVPPTPKASAPSQFITRGEATEIAFAIAQSVVHDELAKCGIESLEAKRKAIMGIPTEGIEVSAPSTDNAMPFGSPVRQSESAEAEDQAYYAELKAEEPNA